MIILSQYILKYGARNVRLPIELISFSTRIKKVHAQL